MGFLQALFEERAGRTGQSFHVSQTPPAWVDRLFGSETASGVVVDEGKALELSAVFGCVRILAETVASLPRIVYRREGEGKTRAPDHPLYPLLHDAPNDEMTAMQFWEAMMGHLTLWGNAYAEIEWSRGGQVLGLWPLRPDRMRVKRVDGKLVYEYTLYGADRSDSETERTFQAWQVLHIPALGFDGLVGYSPISMARQAVGLGLAAEEFGSRFFSNDARPGGVLQHPGQLSDTAHQHLLEGWESRHQALERKHRVAILEEGMEFKEIGLPPQDAQFLETRKFQVTEIARIFRVPPHMLADLDRATFSNIEHQSIEFVMHSIRPWLVRIEQASALQLLTPAQRKQYFVEHIIDALLRGDIQSRYQAYAVARQWGWMSGNDVRRLENQDPVDGLDQYLVPLNMIPAGEAGRWPQGGSGPLAEEGRSVEEPHPLIAREREQRSLRAATVRHRLRRAYYPLFEEVAARVMRRERNDVGNKARQLLGKANDVPSFLLWLEDFYREHQAFTTEQVRALYWSYGQALAPVVAEELGQGDRAARLAETREIPEELEAYIEAYIDEFARRSCSVSRARLRALVEEALEAGEDPLEALEALLDEWTEKRSAETARWESSRFNNAVAKALYVSAGIARLIWQAFGDSCPYCSALNGRIISIHETFLPEGEFQPDGAERPLTVTHFLGHPPAHDGCDCMAMASY